MPQSWAQRTQAQKDKKNSKVVSVFLSIAHVVFVFNFFVMVLIKKLLIVMSFFKTNCAESRPPKENESEDEGGESAEAERSQRGKIR